MEPTNKSSNAWKRKNQADLSVVPTYSLKTTCLIDIEEKEIEWLWKPYIPQGKITIMEGNPGQGKTFAMLGIAAKISRGEYFEDRLPRNVLYATAEDGYADTIKPRLLSMHADPAFIHGIEGIQDDSGQIVGAFTLQELSLLEKTMTDLRPALLVIDPIQAFLGKGVSMNQATGLRGIMTNVAQFAEKFQCAVVCIRHFAKRSGKNSTHLGMGSIDLAAVARSILVVGPHPTKDELRVIVPSKASLAPNSDAALFRIQDGNLEWKGYESITVQEVLEAGSAKNKNDRYVGIDTWLREILKDGPRKANYIFNAGINEGYSKKQLNTAKDRLRIESTKMPKHWEWSLPEPTLFSEGYSEIPVVSATKPTTKKSAKKKKPKDSGGVIKLHDRPPGDK